MVFLAPSKRSELELGVSAEFLEIVDEGVRGMVVQVETVALATISTSRNGHVNSFMHAAFKKVASCTHDASHAARSRSMHVHAHD